MLTSEQLDKIQDSLFSNSDNNVYAIIDGAACPELRFKIYDYQPVYSCLWSGRLEPDLEEVAPYMVKLDKGGSFTKWLLTNGHDKNWNIFIQSNLDPKLFRKQIRKLNLVRSPEGQNMVFRFYDPRVIDIFIPTCSAEQLQEIFSGINKIQYSRRGDVIEVSLDEESCAVYNELSIH